MVYDSASFPNYVPELMAFPVRLRKRVASKVRQTGRPYEHFSKTTGLLKKQYKK